MSTFKDLNYKYNNLDLFGKIIVINAIIFILNFLTTILFKWDIAQYFVLPSSFMDFILQPWSIITYGFFHSGFWHILFNMLLLFYLARVTTNLFRTKMMLNVFFLGIIFGGVAYMAVANILPTNLFRARGVLLGSSAGVSALLMFVAVYMPETQIRLFNAFNIKWKHIAMVFVAFDVFRLFLGLNQGGYIAHIGGYLLGYVYASRLLKGMDIGSGFERMMDGLFSWFKPKSKLKTVHRKKGKSGYAGKTKQEFDAFNKQKKIDMILDKISKSGYDSLTSEEKEFLFKAGKD